MRGALAPWQSRGQQNRPISPQVATPQAQPAPAKAARLAACAATALFLAAAGLPEPLEGLQGDPARGRAVVARQASTCILCHAGPFPNPHLQGSIGPDLHGVGARLAIPELRAQIVDARSLNPDSPMPSFWRTDGRTRVGPAWQGRPILQAQEIEDAVAYLSTLRDPPPDRAPPPARQASTLPHAASPQEQP